MERRKEDNQDELGACKLLTDQLSFISISFNVKHVRLVLIILHMELKQLVLFIRKECWKRNTQVMYFIIW